MFGAQSRQMRQPVSDGGDVNRSVYWGNCPATVHAEPEGDKINRGESRQVVEAFYVHQGKELI